MNIHSLIPANRYFPKEWKVAPFDEAFEDITGGNVKIKQSDYKPTGLLPIIDQGQEQIAGYVDDPSFSCQAPLPVVLFGDHTKSLKFVDKPFVLGADGVKVLSPCPELDAKFAFYYLQLVRLPSDAGYSRHFKFLKRITVPLPPLDEQRRIATILDRADVIRRKRQESIRLTEEFLRSDFLDMFGDPVTNPKGWQMGSLGDLVLSVKDGPHVSPQYAQEGVPFLSARHIKPGRITWDDLKYVTREEAQRHWKRCKPEKGDILYTKGGTTGIAAVYDSINDIAIWVHVALLKPNLKKVNPHWLENMLNTRFCYNQSQKYTHGITNQDLGLTRMIKIKMYIPPIEEQERFFSRVQKVKKIYCKQVMGNDLGGDLFGALTQRAFRGELS